MIIHKSLQYLCLAACYESKYPNMYHTPFENKEHFDFGVIDGFLAELDSDSKVIVFRGSDEFIDWPTNFLFGKKEVPYNGTNPKIKVHSGWINRYRRIREFIHYNVQGYKEVIVTGQSLGAAIATLCALDLQYNFFASNRVACLPFGSPKVGNKHFVESYNLRVPNTYRWVHGRDLIPLLPFPNYRHVSFMRKFGPDRKVMFIPSISQHKISQDQLDNFKEDVLGVGYSY